MTSQAIASGTVHALPDDLRAMIKSHPIVRTAWADITPLARNEFICWITSAKQDATRARRIDIARDKLSRGERRPCCWIGCIHRPDKPLSPSVRGILASRARPTNSQRDT